MVTAIDEVILQIKESLESNDMLDNSIIIFASDNGGLPGRVSIQGVKSLWGVASFFQDWAPGTLTSGA